MLRAEVGRRDDFQIFHVGGVIEQVMHHAGSAALAAPPISSAASRKALDRLGIHMQDINHILDVALQNFFHVAPLGDHGGIQVEHNPPLEVLGYQEFLDGWESTPS